MLRTPIRRAFTVALLFVGVQGCTCAPATVDLVQPNAVSKSVFMSGEWYFQNTVTEVPYGTATTFTGAKSAMTRIRWRIEEDLLLGYRSFELVTDTDALRDVDVDGDGRYWGAPVVAYRIESHFDIRRAYSRTTGEEYNTIEENRERPWQEREYMRVDWSTNFAEPNQAFTFGGVRLSVTDFYPEDPSDPLSPDFDDSDGDGIIDSILLHSKVLAEPTTTYYPGYGAIPVCIFYGKAFYECVASEVTIASSFIRVDPDRDYLGLDYDARWMRTFGYFNTMRLTYDRHYNIPEDNRIWYANRHNLWGEWFQRDADGQILCGATQPDGSVRTGPCHTFLKEEGPEPLLKRYADRPVRVVAYHLSEDYDRRLLPVTVEGVNGWNEPFRDTVNQLRFWECLEEGGDATVCADVVDPDLEVFVLCPNNPSQPGDPEVCDTDHTGPDGRPDGRPDVARRGDLRYHFIDLVRNPLLASPFGYGPSAADPKGGEIPLADDGDPDTADVLVLGAGEIINATAFVYEWALDYVATEVADLVALINGDIGPDAYVAGENVTAWVDYLNGTGSASLAGSVYSGGGASAPGPGDPAAADILATMDTTWASMIRAERADGAGVPTVEEGPAGIDAFWADMRLAIESSGVFGAGAAEVRANWEYLKDSPFDDLLWNEETVGAYGFDPLAVLSGQVDLDDRSPLDLIDPVNLDERNYWEMLAGMNAVCLMDDTFFTDPTLLGLAQTYANMGLSYEEIRTEVRSSVYRGVLEHEIGHTLGLRHNFAASYDAWNYFPEYWELRDDGNMGPRHVDPETPAETLGRIREYKYSSVMDYHAGRNSDWKGLGKWDYAAIKFGYGQLVEVMTGTTCGAQAIPGLPNCDATGWISYFNGTNVYPVVSGLSYTDGSWLEMHYTDYPAIAGDLEARVDVPLDKLTASSGFGGSGDDGYDVGFGDMLVAAEAVPGVIEEGSPAAPYRFCSDEFAFGLSCARFDEGADPYESITYTMQKYWNYYLLNNFKRGRYGFQTSNAYLSRVYGRYMDPLMTWARYYVLFHALFGVESDADVAAYFAADRGYGGWTVAMGDTFQWLTRIIMRPEPGMYASTYRADGTLYNVNTTSDGDFSLPLIASAYYSSDWDFDAGYYWFDQQTLIGSFYDKLLALQTLTYSSTYGYLGLDTFADPREYALGFQDIWRDQIALFFGGLVADDRAEYAPIHMADDTLMYPDMLDKTRVWPPEGMEADVVRPGAYWYIHYAAGVVGMAALQRGYDNTFLDRARIYMAGNGTTVTPPAGVTTIEYNDPTSGVTYVAWSYPARDKLGGPLLDAEGQVIEIGVGARMLVRANRLRALCNLEEVAPYTDPTDLSDDNGNGVPDSLDAQAAVACDELDRFTNDIKTHADVFNYFWSPY